MSPPFPSAAIELDYPLYALDFDPEDANRFAVGGGGGAGRSGVGNKISIIETVSENELRAAGQIDLSRDEDSVMSLAYGAHKGKQVRLFAGVNSSPESLAKGKNEHLRTFIVEQSKSRVSVGAKIPEVKVAEAGRSALFTSPDADTYQRLLRVKGTLGAAATAMGKESQLAIFDVSGNAPVAKGVLELPKDAEDIDIVQVGEKEYDVAFCYKYELHVVRIGKEGGDPELIFTMPDDHGERPAFRSIRYISPHFLVATANLPKRSGILIQGFRLPTPGHPTARIAATVRIPGKKSSTALAVANLAPPASPTAPLGNTQFLIAVAAHDSSIALYTMNHKTSEAINLLTELHPLRTIKDVHGADNITGLAFSNYVTPKTHIREQFIKLASISLQKTVAVQNIPLKKYVDKTPRKPGAPPRPVRYVTAMNSQEPFSLTKGILIYFAIVTVILAIIGQGSLEVLGFSKPIVHANKIMPSWLDTFKFRYPVPPPAGLLKEEFLRRLSVRPEAGETLVIREGGVPEVDAVPDGETSSDPKHIDVEVHDPNVHGPGQKWDELAEEQKHAWKERLHEAGAWTQSMGESVFKGILFGEIAQAVGNAVGG